MKVVALVSGGKDSCYAMMKSIHYGHQEANSRINKTDRHQELGYRTTQGDEVEDMFILLREVKKQMPEVTAVSSGVVASDYQRLRVESVCSRACVEIKPVLYADDFTEVATETITESSGSESPAYWGFNPENWHDSCIQKLVVPGKICAVTLSLTSEDAEKICFHSKSADSVMDGQYLQHKSLMEKQHQDSASIILTKS